MASDPNVHPDDFVSISCPTSIHCYLLDAAGNLLFSGDRGKSFAVRAHHAQLGLRKIRFSGLVNGWGLDIHGGLWHTRDSGMSFESILIPKDSRVADIAQDITQRPGIWLAHPGGMIRYLDKNAHVKIEKRLEKSIRSLSVCGQYILVSSSDGTLTASSNGGDKWKTFGRIGDEMEKLADQVVDGRVLSFDRIGQVMLMDPKTGSLEILFSASVTRWMDAAFFKGGWILVGERGNVAYLQAALNQEIKFELIKKSLSDTVALVAREGGPCLAVYRNGWIWKCHEYAGRWTSLGQPLPPPVKTMSFPSSSFGVALVGTNSIFRTKSGGATWEKIGSWPDMNLWDVFFINERVGWAVGDHGSVVHTLDGGLSWTIGSLPSAGSLRKIRFFDEETGWIVGDNQLVYRTLDAGRNWDGRSLGEGMLYDLVFLDSDTGFLVGENGTILGTRDGGQNWQAMDSDTRAVLKTIAFLDDQRGIIGGDSGLMLQSMDGGDTWMKLDLHTKVDIFTAICPNSYERCLIGGQNGLLMTGRPFDQLP